MQEQRQIFHLLVSAWQDALRCSHLGFVHLVTMFTSEYLIFFIATKMGFSPTLWAKSGNVHRYEGYSCLAFYFTFKMLMDLVTK